MPSGLARHNALHPPRRAPGFSVIEALVVVAVIAILATLAMPPVFDRIARQQIKDEDLAGALAALERADLPAAESRRRALDEIRARYTV